jgi:hypothetical protein
VPDGRARVSTASLLERSAGEPEHRWPQLIEGWLREIDQQVNASLAEPSGVDRSRLRLRAVPSEAETPGSGRLELRV